MTAVLHLLKLTGDRMRFCILVAASALVGVLDVMGIGLILPLASLIIIPDHPTLLRILDRLFGVSEVSHSLILQIGLALFAIFILKNVFAVFALRAMYRFSSDGSAKVAKRLLFLYFNAPMEYYAGRNSVEFIRALREFAPMSYNDGVLGLGGLLGEGASFLLLIGLLIAVAPLPMALGATVLFALLALNHFVLGRRMVRWGQGAADSLRTTYKEVAQVFPVMKEIRVAGRARHFEGRVLAVLRAAADLRRKQLFAAQVARPVTEVFMLLAFLVVLATLLAGGRTLLEILPTIAVFAAATIRLLPLVNRLSQMYNRLRAAQPAVGAVAEELARADALEAEIRERGSPQPPAFERTLELRDVAYRYPGAADGALNGVSLTLNKGELVGLVGPSGSGKSTLADIILGLIAPSQGAVLVDGREVAAQPSGAGARVAYVPQETLILDDTLRRNIAFGLDESEISEERVRRAIDAAHLGDVVGRLERGVDSGLGDRGQNFSGGERQRVGIARALYGSPDLLVLDEVTSGLDARTEQEITSAIVGLKGHATVVVIAHRLHTLKACDRIFFLEDGRVTAEGSYEELMATCPGFARLAEIADTRVEGRAPGGERELLALDRENPSEPT